MIGRVAGILIVAAWVAQAQSTGSVAGTVTADGAAVANAQVTLSNADTGAQVSAKTDAEGRYEFAEVTPGTYTLRVEAPGFRSVEQRDIVVQGGRTFAASPELARPPRRVMAKRAAPRRETGRTLLFREQKEEQGYGLYSYLLFGSLPSEATRGRYLAAVQAYLEVISDVAEVLRDLPRERVNVTYLLVKTTPDGDPKAEWLLENYDYPRARALLDRLPGGSRNQGPYIVSTATALESADQWGDLFLYQDLSSVPPSLVTAWVKEFINQAGQEEFWKDRTLARRALVLRTAIERVAVALPDVTSASKDWKDLLATLILPGDSH